MGHSPSPFWCLCQKLSLFLYFNETLLYKSSWVISMVAASGAKSSEIRNPTLFTISYQPSHPSIGEKQSKDAVCNLKRRFERSSLYWSHSLLLDQYTRTHTHTHTLALSSWFTSSITVVHYLTSSQFYPSSYTPGYWLPTIVFSEIASLVSVFSLTTESRWKVDASAVSIQRDIDSFLLKSSNKQCTA